MRARRGRRGTGTAGIELVVRQPWSGKTRTAATMRAARARFLRQGRGGRHGGASAPNGGARRGLQRRRFDGERELRLVHGGEQERRREREGAGLGLGFGERGGLVALLSTRVATASREGAASSGCGASDELGRYRGEDGDFCRKPPGRFSAITDRSFSLLLIKPAAFP